MSALRAQRARALTEILRAFRALTEIYARFARTDKTSAATVLIITIKHVEKMCIMTEIVARKVK